MKTFLFAMLLTPWLAWSAPGPTTYTFTLQTVRGPIGFTFASPQPILEPWTYIDASTMVGCETTGAPGWVCLDAYLRQTTINGMPVVQVTMDIVYLPGLGDGFATDQLTESFPGASLAKAGSYTGFLSPATFTITRPSAHRPMVDTSQEEEAEMPDIQ